MSAAAPVEQAARRVLDAGLGQGRSAIERATSAWTPEVAADLRRRVIDNADEGAGAFLTKLRAQLAGAPRATVLLAAELLFLQVVPLCNVTAKTKRERVGAVLSWLQPPVSLAPDLDKALGAPGVFNGGVGFNVQIWRQIGWLLSFVEEWWRRSDDVRMQALREPWSFRDVVASLAVDQPSIRNALLYLAFPRTFFPIVSQDHKRAIRDAFASVIGGASGKDAISIDRDLVAINARQAEQAGLPAIDYYQPPFLAQWQKQTAEAERAWLVRPRMGGGELVGRWTAEGFVSLAATHLGEVPAGADRDQVRAAVEVGYQHLDYAQRLALATEYHHFLSGMRVDDLVLTVADDYVRVGVLTGEPEYTTENAARLRRAVVWSSAEPVPVFSLAAPLPEQLAQQGTVVDLTAAYAVISRLARVETELLDNADAPEPAPLVPSGPPVLRAATGELASRLHTEVSWLQRIIHLLQDRQQIVLYGPPGTGKTYLARELARHLTDPDAVRLVQFHPSYSYEDFFEGYRPTKAPDGTVGFELHPGPLRELAAAAREDRQRPYLLIIDEINRANLAKVFGELYFLLEYRNDTIRLQYSPDKPFTLPPNVFLIGTMNTADRSIALVDAAMRRRFAFIELHPEVPPVCHLLPNWLAANGKQADERAVLLAALNSEIGAEDRDYQIGPSYLMTPDAEHDDGLDRIWDYSILPLLEEHYYGRLGRRQVHERFGLAAIRGKATGQAGPSAGPSGP